MNWKFSLFLFGILCMSCQDQKIETAQDIIDKAIRKQCSGNCDAVRISFDFRNKHYVSTRQGGEYQLERRFSDSLGSVVDILKNDGFIRTINEADIKLSDSLRTLYGNSVNSVHYFSQLPFGLNDAAVQKELLGNDTIAQQPYYEIKVTFKKEGGGTDFEDEFVYWVHSENYTIDYLAYSYATEGGGIRFREAYNPRKVNGIRFVDYRNYKPNTLTVALADLDDWFQADSLQLLSTIENTSISVDLLNP